MRLQSMLADVNELHHLWWLSADNAARTFNQISAMRTTLKLAVEASKSPVAPSAPQSAARHLARLRPLLHRFVASTPEHAAKSP
jgi:hypothetical protein